MTRSKRPKTWLQSHSADPYVKQARQAGFRSRSAYKLLELVDRDRLLRPGMTVVDLGAAPGGWSQVAARQVRPGGRVIAVDLLPADPVPDTDFILGDLRDDAVRGAVEERVGGRVADVVVCDMAPNLTGRRDVDEANTAALNELALDFAGRLLTHGGTMVIKTFHGEGFEGLRSELRMRFSRVDVRKPKASRSQSSEVYLLARGFEGGN